MQNRPVFKKIVKKTKCMLRKEITFKRKFILKVLYLNSTNRNFISLMEGAISINALILWNEHISQAVNFKQANTHYDMTKIVKHSSHRKEHYTMHISFRKQLNSSPANFAPP